MVERGHRDQAWALRRAWEQVAAHPPPAQICRTVRSPKPGEPHMRLVAKPAIGGTRVHWNRERVQTLYEWAGGQEAFDRMIDAFYDESSRTSCCSRSFTVGCTSSIGAMWPHGGQRSSEDLLRYSEQLGGYERMLSKHRQLGITDEQRFRFASLMSLAADDAGMPNDPEFRSALVAYLEWGTRIALSNSQRDDDVIAHATVPRWGWGEVHRTGRSATSRCSHAAVDALLGAQADQRSTGRQQGGRTPTPRTTQRPVRWRSVELPAMTERAAASVREVGPYETTSK